MPGAVASQDWFVKNLQDALKVIPQEKIICAVANYGYDWAMKKGQKKGTPPEDVHNVSAQDAWLEASDAETDINFDDDAMNPHFAYLGRKQYSPRCVVSRRRHRAEPDAGRARAGHRYLRLWRLGSEDRSLWAVWDKPFEADAPDKLNAVPPGQDVDDEGMGEIIRIQSRPAAGERTITVDPDTNLISDEIFQTLPMPYVVDMYGGTQRKEVAITFDDGPDPEWTPKILDVLKQYGVKATFFLIGAEVEKYPGVAKRIFAEGHEIGNHTFTHPDISTISKRYFEVELNLTERLFESKLRREAGADAASVRDRRSARHRRPGSSAGDGAGPRLHHGRREDRSQRLARQSSASRPRRLRTTCLANLPPCAPGESALRQHHSAARWRRRSQPDGDGSGPDPCRA